VLLSQLRRLGPGLQNITILLCTRASPPSPEFFLPRDSPQTMHYQIVPLLLPPFRNRSCLSPENSLLELSALPRVSIGFFSKKPSKFFATSFPFLGRKRIWTLRLQYAKSLFGHRYGFLFPPFCRPSQMLESPNSCAELFFHPTPFFCLDPNVLPFGDSASRKNVEMLVRPRIPETDSLSSFLRVYFLFFSIRAQLKLLSLVFFLERLASSVPLDREICLALSVPGMRGLPISFPPAIFSLQRGFSIDR